MYGTALGQIVRAMGTFLCSGHWVPSGLVSPTPLLLSGPSVPFLKAVVTPLLIWHWYPSLLQPKIPASHGHKYALVVIMGASPTPWQYQLIIYIIGSLGALATPSGGHSVSYFLGLSALPSHCSEQISPPIFSLLLMRSSLTMSILDGWKVNLSVCSS